MNEKDNNGAIPLVLVKVGKMVIVGD